MTDLSTPTVATPPVPWTVWDVVGGVLSWLGLLSGLGLLIYWLDLTVDNSLIIIFGEATLLLPTWYFTIYKYGAKWADLGLRPFNPRVMRVGCWLMVAFFLFHLIYATLLAFFGLQTQPGLDKIFTNTAFPALLFVGGAFIAPFVEEIFFRGFIFSGLRQHWGWQKAIVISSVLFALAHLVPTSLLPVFLLGLIFAFVAQISGSIWPAIIIHTFNNLIALLMVLTITLLGVTQF